MGPPVDSCCGSTNPIAVLFTVIQIRTKNRFLLLFSTFCFCCIFSYVHSLAMFTHLQFILHILETGLPLLMIYATRI